MTNLPLKNNGFGAEIRKMPEFDEMCKEVRIELEKSLAEDDIVDFSVAVLRNALNPPETLHNSHQPQYVQFYNRLFEAARVYLQEPNPKNQRISTAMVYLERLEFVGVAPQFRTNVALRDAELEDVEPVFRGYCQLDGEMELEDEETGETVSVPVMETPVAAFQFAVDRVGDFHFQVLDTSFLDGDTLPEKQQVVRAEDLQPQQNIEDAKTAFAKDFDKVDELIQTGEAEVQEGEKEAKPLAVSPNEDTPNS